MNETYKGLSASIMAALYVLIYVPNAFASTFIGYEFGEMTLNKFKNFAGEIGYQFDNKSSVRFVYMDVVLSESHLSSDAVRAVDGDNVKGIWTGFEIYYDVPIKGNFLIGASTGRFRSKYNHTTLDESVEAESNTVGVAVSYLGDDVLGFEQLYWRLTGTYRYYFDPIKETMLGDATVRSGKTEFVPWIFVGYRF